MIHYQFEAIHPFLDGNGRVGRLLIVLLLCEWRLLSQPLLNLSIYIEHYRQEYYDLLLGVSQQGAWEAWLRFFLRGVSEQAQESVFRMERLQDIRGKYQPFVEQDRNSLRMAAVIDFLGLSFSVQTNGFQFHSETRANAFYSARTRRR